VGQAADCACTQGAAIAAVPAANKSRRFMKTPKGLKENAMGHRRDAFAFHASDKACSVPSKKASIQFMGRRVMLRMISRMNEYP
jgi:hypothetical protein